MKKEHELGSLNSCIDELQQQDYAQRLELENAHHGFLYPYENNLDYKKNYL